MARLSAMQRRIERDRQEVAEAVASAAGFATHFRKGPHESYTINSETLVAARAEAARLNTEHGKYGRRAIVYALSPRGARTPVPASYEPS